VVGANAGWLVNSADLPPEVVPLVHPKAIACLFGYASPDPDRKAASGAFEVEDASYPVEIRLSFLNEIYVMDKAAGSSFEREVKSAMTREGRTSMTREETKRIRAASVLTLLEAKDYEGGYVEPVYVIGRALHENEARVMRGPVSIEYDAPSGQIASRLHDERSGTAIGLLSCTLRAVGRFADMRHVVSTTERIADRLLLDVEIDRGLVEEMEALIARSRVSRNAGGTEDAFLAHRSGR
jgi:hypothetical protein